MLISLFLMILVMRIQALSPVSSFGVHELLMELIQKENIFESLQVVQIQELNVNQTTEPLHRTVLMEATIKGKIELVEALLNKQEINMNQKDIEGDTAWHLAVKHNQVEIFRLMIQKKGKDFNIGLKNESGETAFTLVLKKESQSICEILRPYISDEALKEHFIDAIEEADVNQLNYLKSQYAKQYDDNKEGIIKILEKTVLALDTNSHSMSSEDFSEKVIKINNIFNQIYIYKGEQDFVGWCVRRHLYSVAEVLVSGEGKREKYTNYLFKMAQNESDKEVFKFLLTHLIPGYLRHKQALTSVQEEGLKMSDEEVNSLVEILKEKKYDLYEQHIQKYEMRVDWYCLMTIIGQKNIQNQEDIIRYLCRHFTKSDLTKVNERGNNLISQTLLAGNITAFQLLQQYFEPLSQEDFIQDSYGRGPLMQIIQSGNLELLKEWGKERTLNSLKTEKDIYDNTPLIMLVAFQRKKMLEHILMNHASEINLTQTNKMGEDALIIALSKSQWDLYHQIFVHTSGMFHLYYLNKMVKKDNVKAVQHLLKFISREDLLQEDESGQNIIVKAIEIGTSKVLLDLLKNKASQECSKDERIFIAHLKKNKNKLLKVLMKCPALKENQQSSQESDLSAMQKNIDSVVINLVKAVEKGDTKEVRDLVFLEMKECPQWTEVYKEALLVSLLKGKDEITNILITAHPNEVEDWILDSLIHPLKKSHPRALKIIWESAFDREDLVLIEYLLKVKKINPSLNSWKGLVEAVCQGKKEVLMTIMGAIEGKQCSDEERRVWQDALMWSFKENKLELSEILIAGTYAKGELLKRMNSEVIEFKNYLRKEKRVSCQQDVWRSSRGLIALPFYKDLSRHEIEEYLNFSQEKNSVYQEEFKKYESYLLNAIYIEGHSLEDKKEVLKDEEKFLESLRSRQNQRFVSGRSILLKEGPKEVTLIMYAAYKGWVTVVKYLHQELGAPLEKCDSKGRSALFYLCMTGNLLKVAEFFNFKKSRYVEYFEDLRIKGGTNLLMYAVSQGAFDLAILLMKAGKYCLTEQSKFEFSVLDFLILRYGRQEGCSEVIEEFINIRFEKMSAKTQLIQRRDEEHQGRQRQIVLEDLEKQINKHQNEIDKMKAIEEELWYILSLLGHKEGFDYMVKMLSQSRREEKEENIKEKLIHSVHFMYLYNYSQMREDCIQDLKNIRLKSQSIRKILGNMGVGGFIASRGSDILNHSIFPYLYELYLFKKSPEMLIKKLLKYKNIASSSMRDVENLIGVILVNPHLDQEKLIKEVLKTAQTTLKMSLSIVAFSTLIRIIEFNIPVSTGLLRHLFSHLKFSIHRTIVLEKAAMSLDKKQFDLLLKAVIVEDIYDKINSQHWKGIIEALKSLLREEEQSVSMNNLLKSTKLQYLMTHCKDFINQQNDIGQTVLMVAIQEWDMWRIEKKSVSKMTSDRNGEQLIQIIKELLITSKGHIDLNIRDCRGKTVIQYAIEAQSLDIFKLLVHAGAPLDLEAHFHQSDLHLALNNCPSIAQYILEKFPFVIENKEIKRALEENFPSFLEECLAKNRLSKEWTENIFMSVLQKRVQQKGGYLQYSA